MPSGDVVGAHPPLLTDASGAFSGKAGLIQDYRTNIQTASKNLSTILGGASELSSLASTLDDIASGIDTIMGCFSDALIRTSGGLVNTAQSFQSTDGQLSTILLAVEQSLQPFTGYETSGAASPPTPSPTPAPTTTSGAVPSPSSTPSPTPGPAPTPPDQTSDGGGFFHRVGSVLGDIGSGIEHGVDWLGHQIPPPPVIPNGPAGPGEPPIEGPPIEVPILIP